MKILCICQQGNSRSVALAYLLKKHGNDAIAIGIRSTKSETREMLYEWADKIVVVVDRYKYEIPAVYKSKLKVYDVGSDVYFLGYKPKLIEKYEKFLKEDPL